MKLHHILLTVFSLIGFQLLLSCQMPAPDPEPAQPVRISRIQAFYYQYYGTSNLRVETYALHYDSKGRIDEYIKREDDKDLYKSTLTYNKKGQLARIDEMPVYSGSNMRSVVLLEYDQLDRVIVGKVYSTALGEEIILPHVTVVYEYDTSNNPTKVSRTIRGAPFSESAYTFTKENATRWFNSATSFTNTYAYDDKPNPFYGQLLYDYGSIPLPVGHSMNSFNRNNLILHNDDKQELTYNENGMLTKWHYGEVNPIGRNYISIEYEVY